VSERHLEDDCDIRGTLSGTDACDAELLERFVTSRDETAFAALMARHGVALRVAARARLLAVKRRRHEGTDVEPIAQATREAAAATDLSVAITVEIVITADKIKVSFPDKSRESTYKIDPTAKPKTIDTVPTEGVTELGIYKLEGDVLTICATLGQADKERPSEFNSKEDSGTMRIVLKRVKK